MKDITELFFSSTEFCYNLFDMIFRSSLGGEKKRDKNEPT
jgi:hypothetical protein